MKALDAHFPGALMGLVARADPDTLEQAALGLRAMCEAVRREGVDPAEVKLRSKGAYVRFDAKRLEVRGRVEVLVTPLDGRPERLAA